MVPMPNQHHKTPEEFWEGLYSNASPRSGGKPGTVLKRFTVDMEPGRALDMGCARGDDAVWLAQRGWTVTAVDISSTVLRYASDNAARAGVLDRISFEHHDLSGSFPSGLFDLVLASYLQSPVEFARKAALRRAAASVAPCGHLFITEHASRAPWSWAPPDTRFPTAEETFSSLELDPQGWLKVHIGTDERIGKGRDGREATVRDNVILLRRRQ